MINFKVARSEEDVLENIRNYEVEVGRDQTLRSRMRRHPAWYAFRDDAARWHFGPSKFVGYADMTCEAYLDYAAERLDGRETEPVLGEWFELVEDGTDLHAQLLAAFNAFAGTHGAKANKRWRVSVSKLRQKTIGRRETFPDDLAKRVVSNPAICGGRPTIKGTRVRVSDIVEMLAHGVSVEEIVADFPQLSSKDVHAALHFAARLMDQSIVHAA
ncbi:hypothetical protein BH10PSE7_BH10PSE7_22060 [soil metagenome]